jgi:predicted NodU family carbamoyl transferase
MNECSWPRRATLRHCPRATAEHRVPMVLNTCFNDSEPIVCTPADAIATFRKTRIDALFIGNRFVTRESQL